MSSEDQYIKNTENAIRKLKFGTTEKSEVMKTVGFNLSKLKSVNEGMYQDLLQKYKVALQGK